LLQPFLKLPPAARARQSNSLFTGSAPSISDGHEKAQQKNFQRNRPVFHQSAKQNMLFIPRSAKPLAPGRHVATAKAFSHRAVWGKVQKR